MHFGHIGSITSESTKNCQMFLPRVVQEFTENHFVWASNRAYGTSRNYVTFPRWSVTQKRTYLWLNVYLKKRAGDDDQAGRW